MLCMNLAPGTAWPGNAVGVVKTVARVDAAGFVDSSSGASNMMTAGNYYLYSAVTPDGSGHYVTGPSSTACDNNAGVRYIPHGGSVSVQLNATFGRCNYDSRYATIWNGQLVMVFGDAGKRGPHFIGAGLPTTAGQRTALFPGFEAASVQAVLTATLGALVFEGNNSLWLVDAGAVATRHVHNLVRSGPDAPWVPAPVPWVRFNTSNLIHSATGRYEAGRDADAVEYFLYVVSNTGTANTADGRLWRYSTTTGEGWQAPIAVNTMPNSKWRAVMVSPMDPRFAAPTPSSTPTRTASRSATRSMTGSSSATPSASGTGTLTPTGTTTPTSSNTASASGTASVTATATSSLTSGSTSSITSSVTASASTTATRSATASQTSTVSNSASGTASPTGSRTSTRTPSATPSPKNLLYADGNIVVIRAGDGTAQFGGATSVAAPLFAEEINLLSPDPSVYGTIAQRVSLAPTSGAYNCTWDNYYWRDGFGAQRSADGRFITVLCMNLAPGTAWPGNAVGVVKTVARVDAAGFVDSSSGASNMMTAGNYYLYSAVTPDGSGHYVMGPSSTACDNNAGVRYIPHGGSVSVQLNATLGRCNYDSRYATIWNGQLYAVFGDAGKRGVHTVGSGLPTTAGQMTSLLPGFEATAVQSTLTATLGALVFAGNNSLWLVDAGAVATRHVHNLVRNPTTGVWALAPSIRFNTPNLVHSATGRFEASRDGADDFVLYALSASGVAGSADGALWRYSTQQASGLDAPIATNPTLNTRWRSVLLSPTDAGMRGPTATSTASGTPSNSPTGSLTPSSTATATATASGTGSMTASASTTRTPTSTVSGSKTPTASRSPSRTFTPTRSITPTVTGSPTPSVSATGSGTGSTSPSASATSSGSASPTGTPSSSATETGTPSSSATGSDSPSASPTTTQSGTPSTSSTVTATPPASASRTVPPSGTGTKTRAPVLPTRSATATKTRTRTATKTKTKTKSKTPSKKRKVLRQ